MNYFFLEFPCTISRPNMTVDKRHFEICVALGTLTNILVTWLLSPPTWQTAMAPISQSWCKGTGCARLQCYSLLLEKQQEHIVKHGAQHPGPLSYLAVFFPTPPPTVSPSTE